MNILTPAQSAMPMSISAARRRRRFVAMLYTVSAVAMSACLSVDDTGNNNRYGSVNLRATGSAADRFSATATVVFFTGGAATLPNSATSTDQCAQFPYSGDQIVPGNLTGGTPLNLRVGGTSYAMTESPTVARIYTLPAPGVAMYSVGDSATLSVPGVAGGFPGGQVSVRLAEPVRLGQLTPVVLGNDFPLSWAANGDPRSGIVISMRFGVGATADLPTRQLLCSVRDNGAYTIPGGLLTEFVTSPPGLRSVNVLRWRTNEVSVDERSKLHIVSTIDTTVINLPQP